MLEEETQHLPSVRIGVGAGWAASRPCMSGSVDFPVLQDATTIGIAVDGAGVGMPAGMKFIRVPAAKSSGDCVQPWSMITSGMACP